MEHSINLPPHSHSDSLCGVYRPSRREVLKTLAAMGAATLVPGSLAFAQSAAQPQPTIIDVHHHMFPARYKVLKRQAIIDSTMFPKVPFGWTPAKSIEEMDRNGVATAFISLPPPGIWFHDDVKQGRMLARVVNEAGAQAAKDYPGRFGFFAAVPAPDVNGSLHEIAYAMDHLHANGIGFFTSYTVSSGGKPGTKWLGDPTFAPIFDELNRRKATVFVHPDAPICCLDLVAPPPLLELPFDTTRTIASLLFSGTLTRCPNINFIFSHGGGTVPMLAARMEIYPQSKPALREKIPEGVQFYLRKLYFDTASAFSVPAMSAVLTEMPPTQFVFGTDYPYVPIGLVRKGIEESLEKMHGYGNGNLQAIDYQNALRFLPQLKKS